ncbi:hypothetical protein K2X85_07195 [bacterium]|nr:hypothetical protein [bacterium]
MKTVSSYSLSLLILLLASQVVSAQPQYFADQPVNKRSTLIGIGGDVITDKEFAQMAKGLLMTNGNSNVRGATFLFAQCYSGGMLDDLNDTFGTEVRWVGGSAARYDELSWGQSNSTPNALDFWPKAFFQGLDEATSEEEMITYINYARDNDYTGPNGTGAETPQSIYRNGGQFINHHESIPAASGGHNAILWAGKANGIRHVNDIKGMYSRLVADFQATGDPWSIIVLGDSSDLGIAALPATKANLAAAFETLEGIQGPNDNFLFFSSNHGGSETVIIFDPTVLGVGNFLNSRFALSRGEIDGMLGTDDAVPGILLNIDNLIGPGLKVSIDGIVLDDPFEKRDPSGRPFLCIDPRILKRIGPDFEIRFENLTGDRLTINEVAFSTGAITNAIPEVDGFLLIGIATLGFAGSRLYVARYRRSVQAS